MRRDTRGGTYAEWVIAIMPLLTLAMGILQLEEIYTGQMLLDHAATAAARSAAVVVPDDPSHYATEKTQAVEVAALRAMAPYVTDGSFESVRTSPAAAGARGSPVEIEVRATYACKVMLADVLVCGLSRRRELVARGRFVSQAARFAY